MEINYHTHHIVPTHAGGTDNPSNLVKVNRAMHQFMHRLRYRETGDYFDCCAANLLSGDWTVEKARREASKEGQRRSLTLIPAAIKNITDYNNSTPPEQKSANGLAGSLAQSKEDKAKGGRVIGLRPYWNNGLNNKRSHTCPGEGYVLGKLPVGRINRTYKQCPHCESMISSNNLTRHILARHT